MSPRLGSIPGRTDRLFVGRKVTLTLVEQDVVGGLLPLRCEDSRPKAVRDKVAGKGQQQYYWTEAVQLTNTDDRPDFSSEGAPDIDRTVNVKQKLISGHETQMGLDKNPRLKSLVMARDAISVVASLKGHQRDSAASRL
jgi:hypothetical protein